MGKRVLINIVGIVLGVGAGMALMMVLHMASMLVYPPPEGVDLWSQDAENQERVRDWFRTLPTAAFLLATVCHGLGCLGGVIVAMLIAGRRTLWPAVFVGIFFTAGGLMNLASIPHPPWYPFVDLPVYLTLAVIGGLVLFKETEGLEEY